MTGRIERTVRGWETRLRASVRDLKLRGPRAVGDLLFVLFNLFAAAALMLLAAWALLAGAGFLLGHLRPGRTIALGSVIKVDDEKSTTKPEADAALTALLADRCGLLRRPEIPRNAFVELPRSSSLRILERAARASLFDDVDFKLQGLDLPDLFKKLRKALDPPTYTLEGTMRAGGEKTFELRLEFRGKPVRTWTAVQQAATRTATDADAHLVEDAVFQFAYDVLTDDALIALRPEPPIEKPASARALAAFHRGARSLEMYYRLRDPKKLQEGVHDLWILSREAPNDVQALLLLALALAESRRETEAIYTLIRSLDAIARSPKYRDDALLQFAIYLNAASALKRQYIAAKTRQAIADLAALAGLLFDARQGAVPAERDRFGELRAQALIELADCFAVYLGYLRDDTAPELLAELARSLDRPESRALGLSLDPVAVGRLTPGPQPTESSLAETSGAVRSLVDGVFHLHEAVTRQAREELERLPANELTRELGFQLTTSEGYALYRRANWTAPALSPPAPGERDPYQAECEKSFHLYQLAERPSGQRYLTAEYCGILLMDPLFGRRGRLLELAERYLTEGVTLMPDDYFGHLQLANLRLRMLEAEATVGSAGIAGLGIESAERALVSDPHRNEARIRLLQLQTWQWFLDETKREALEPDIRQSLRHLEGEARNPDVLWARVFWLFMRVRAAKTIEEYAEKRKALESAIDPLSVRPILASVVSRSGTEVSSRIEQIRQRLAAPPPTPPPGFDGFVNPLELFIPGRARAEEASPR